MTTTKEKPKTTKAAAPKSDTLTSKLPTDMKTLAKVATENGLGGKFRAWKSAGNPGTVRMSLGNVLRARLRKGEPVKIAGKSVRA